MLKATPLILAFAAIGFFSLRASQAAIFVAAGEAENGVQAGNYSAGDSAGASGNASVKFGLIVDLPSDKPTAANTGVPSGTTLTVVNGDQVYSTDGQVVSGLDIHGKVTISGNNITLKNSIVRGPAGTSCINGAGIEITGSGAIVQDTEVALSNPTACLDGVYASNATLKRVNIHDSVDGVKASSNTSITDSYIHDMHYFTSDPNQGGGATHNDAVQILDGTGITLSGNNLDMSAVTDGNSAIQVTQDFGAVGNLHIDGNWVDGGGCTINIAHKVLASLDTVYVTNNRFGRHQGFNDCAILISTKTTLSDNSGNVWDDTGQPIPAPQQHD